MSGHGSLVKGLDASRELLDIAGKSYPGIEFVQGDAANFTLTESVNVVFSNAVFHWIEKEQQQDMLKCVYNALKINGEFVFEFGGYGNTRRIHNALGEFFSEHGYCYEMSFYFPTLRGVSLQQSLIINIPDDRSSFHPAIVSLLG